MQIIVTIQCALKHPRVLQNSTENHACEPDCAILLFYHIKYYFTLIMEVWVDSTASYEGKLYSDSKAHSIFTDQFQKNKIIKIYHHSNNNNCFSYRQTFSEGIIWVRTLTGTGMREGKSCVSKTIQYKKAKLGTRTIGHLKTHDGFMHS